MDEVSFWERQGNNLAGNHTEMDLKFIRRNYGGN